LLGEAFGEDTGPVEVRPHDHARDHAVHRFVDEPRPSCVDAGASRRTALRMINVDDPITEIDDMFAARASESAWIVRG
jgi:hypothetical protein